MGTKTKNGKSCGVVKTVQDELTAASPKYRRRCLETEIKVTIGIWPFFIL
jgi:hypothetical protein